ncbi:hypothetical protein [Legionella fallonii]|uniref:Uncharacterized protein n=1 Tax=Legionella fallonii LLAP-10 TaxID=1212491 RepID=A0A098GC60_9GAMM|nr:hypothetical protein [Legionella fallonii]CEG59071.1 conserved protein of unknown function [Legionella fallonii LLAP-10]
MGIPKKALRESDLEFLDADSTVEDSSHQTFRVSFSEDGITKKGFFKRLDPKGHYPELLAKISVAVSLFKRLFQGKRSAEERLIYDKDGKIVGTLSLDVEGYQPLNFCSEPVPLDTTLKSKAVPSSETLIEKNIMELLLGRWFLDDDDAHPHNISLEGDIDFDMFFYWFTILMKEPRPIIGIPKKRINLTVRDWEVFPNVKDSLPFHWPSYQYPGQETFPSALHSTIATPWLGKGYADPSQFGKLAGDKKAKEQQLAAAMKILLTYQPEVTRKRLTELFGDMTFNYTSLDEVDVSLRVAYEKAFPLLCNEKSNTMSFVDFMMNLYQKHYDNLYRVVVFYMGCDDNGYGVAMPSTCSSLYHKPSLYRNVEEWVKEQNRTLYSGLDNDELKYDEAELKRRYHQIWRDAYTPTLNELLHNCYQLVNKLLFQLSQQAEVAEVQGKKVTDDSLISASEMLASMPDLSKEKIEPLILVDKNSSFRTALLELADFSNSIHALAKVYYTKERKDLTERDNIDFVLGLDSLYKKYNVSIREKLWHNSNADEFNRIASALKQFIEEVDFPLHLTRTDEQMKETISTTVPKEVLPHTHENIIRRYNDYLFQWAKGLKADDLNGYITDIIDTHYAPYVRFISTRQRAEPVKEYLRKSKSESGDNRLSYIFSTGDTDTGALNQLLIQHLTPIMLQSYPIPSVSNAIKDAVFAKDLLSYTQATVNFAKNDKRFIHLYSSGGMTLFYKTLFDWVETLSDEKFKAIMDSALHDYESGLWFSASSRRKEVEGYLEAYSNKAKVLAFIFLKGEKTSTLSTTLFQKIIAGMKTDIRVEMRTTAKVKPAAKTEEDFEKRLGKKLIMEYNPQEDTDIYEAIKKYSEGPSQKQDVAKSKVTQKQSASGSSALIH